MQERKVNCKHMIYSTSPNCLIYEKSDYGLKSSGKGLTAGKTCSETVLGLANG